MGEKRTSDCRNKHIHTSMLQSLLLCAKLWAGVKRSRLNPRNQRIIGAVMLLQSHPTVKALNDHILLTRKLCEMKVQSEQEDPQVMFREESGTSLLDSVSAVQNMRCRHR